MRSCQAVVVLLLFLVVAHVLPSRVGGREGQERSSTSGHSSIGSSISSVGPSSSFASSSEHAEPSMIKGRELLGRQSQHKRLMPMGAQDVLLFLAAFGILTLAASAGMGGGVLLVPLLSTVGGFPFLETVALSNVAILASAIANMVFNLPRRSTVQPGPVIDYDLLLLFGPPIVMGSIAGSKLNYYIPSWVTKTLVLLVLAPMTWRILAKARMLWRAESEVKRRAKEAIAAAAKADQQHLQPLDLPDDATCGQPPTYSTTHSTYSKDAAAVRAGSATTEAASPFACVQSPLKDPPAVTSPPLGGGHKGQRCASMPHTHLSTALSGVPHGPSALRTSLSEEGPGRPHHKPPLPRQHTFGPVRTLLHELNPVAQHESATLSDLLGPDLMLLKSSAAASATVQIQHSKRLGSNPSGGVVPSRTSSLAGARSQQLQPRMSGPFPSRLGGSFTRGRAGSPPLSRGGSPPRRPGSSPDGSTSWYGEIPPTTVGVNGAAAAPAAAAADTGAVAAAAGPAVGLPATETDGVAAAEAGDTFDDGYDDVGAAGMWGSCGLEEVDDTPVVLSPYELHQQELFVKQETLRQRATLQQQETLQQHATLRQQSTLGLLSLHTTAAAAGGVGGSIKDVEASLPAGTPKDHCRRLDHSGCCHSAELDSKMRARLQHHAAAQYPKRHLAVLVIILMVVVDTILCAHYLLTCGSPQYWAVVLTPLPVMVLLWIGMRFHVLQHLGWQEHLGMSSPGDIAWTAANTLTYPALCIIVGIIAGLLGMGGGMIMTPMLLELGVNPATSAASSQAAMLISSFTASLVYLVNDSVPQDYGIGMALVGLIGTVIGQTAINYIIRRTGRTSLLVFVLALLFVLAAAAGVLMVGLAIVQVVRQPAKLGAIRSDLLCL